MPVKATMVNKGRFTPQQSRICELIAEGLSDKDIARTLAISIKTVTAHTGAIYEKLELRCLSINIRCTAISMMVAKGMIQLSLKSVVLILIFNAVQFTDQAARVGRTPLRTGGSSLRKNADA